MTLLEVFFLISGIIIFFLALDIGRKKKFNALHFFVFLFVGAFLWTVVFIPEMLQFIWDIFGVQRWADVIVYSSIIFLVYFVLLLLRKVEGNWDDLTKLIREIAIENSSKKNIKWKELILIRAYNEGKIIKNTINELLNKWHKNILIINDGSTDNTRLIIWEFNNFENIVILNHLKNIQPFDNLKIKIS